MRTSTIIGTIMAVVLAMSSGCSSVPVVGGYFDKAPAAVEQQAPAAVQVQEADNSGTSAVAKAIAAMKAKRSALATGTAATAETEPVAAASGTPVATVETEPAAPSAELANRILADQVAADWKDLLRVNVKEIVDGGFSVEEFLAENGNFGSLGEYLAYEKYAESYRANPRVRFADGRTLTLREANIRLLWDETEKAGFLTAHPAAEEKTAFYPDAAAASALEAAGEAISDEEAAVEKTK